MKQWWELEIEKGKSKNGNVFDVYQEDCQITITAFETLAIAKYRDFMSITVLGEGGVSCPSGFSVSYPKGATILTPDDINKPLPCRIKVEADDSSHCINGRKYTINFEEKKAASGGGGYRGGGGGGGGSYKQDPEVQERICRTSALYAACYLYQGQAPKEEFIIETAKAFEPYIKGEK